MNKTQFPIKKNIQAVIFDMDGVLIESEALHAEIEQKLLKSFGAKVTKKELKEFTGKRTSEEFKILKKRHKIKAPLKNIRREHEILVENYYKKKFPPTPGIKQIIKTLSRKYKLGLATSSSGRHATMVIKRLGLVKFLNATIFAEDVIKGKPDPEPYLKAAKKLRIKPQNIVVIEDAINGFIAAKKAGMYVIARKNNHNKNQDFSLADKVLTDFKQLSIILAALE